MPIKDTTTDTDLVRVFIQTDRPLLDILRSIEPSSGPIPLALLYVEECLAGKRLAREALRMAKAASIPGTNADLTMLLLARWASLSCRVGKRGAQD